MKLIIIIGNKAYEEDLKKILKSNGVNVFSSNPIEGFHFNGDKNISTNWFGAGKGSEDSVLLFAFCIEETIKSVLTSIKSYNSNDHASKVHAFSLNVEEVV